MSIIIQRWLLNVTGEKLDDATIPEKCSNGYLIAQVLHGYGIIKAIQLSWIKNNYDEHTLTNNFHLIRTWLKFVDIDLTDEVIEDLKCYNESTSASLMFRMYLNLNDRSILYYRAELTKRVQNIYTKRSRFNVEEVSVKDNVDEVEDILDGQQFLMSHSKYVNVIGKKGRHILEWYKRKTCNDKIQLIKLKEACRENLQKIYETNELKQQLEGEVDVRQPRESRLLSLPLIYDVNEMRKCHGNEDIVQKVKDKSTSKNKDDVFIAFSVQSLIGTVFDKIVTELREEVERYVTDKTLKNSDYEKQMLQKLYEAYAMKKVILEDQQKYIKMTDYYETWLDFTVNMKVQDRHLIAYDLYCYEMNRNKELYRRLDESLRTLAAKRLYNFCMEVTTSIVEYVLKKVEFYELYNSYPTYGHQRYWAACFVKGKSYNDYVEDLFELIYYNEENNEIDLETMESYRLEIDKQRAMADFLMEDYAKEKLFFYKKNLEDVVDREEIIYKTNVIVSKLLRTFKLAKYPFIENSKPNLPDFQTRTCLIGLNDRSVLPILRNLMTRHKIVIIEMEDVINYCMDTYVKEDPNFSVENIFIQTTHESFDWINKKAKNPIFRDNDKKWQLIEKKFGQCLNPDDVHNNALKRDMANQFTNNRDNIVKLSTVGELGKLAYLYLYLGSLVPNKYLISMFVEYLKTLTNQKGWILINYPLTMKDAAYMEQCLTGIKYLDKFKKHFEVDQLTDVEWRNIRFVPPRDLSVNKRKVHLFEDYNEPEEPDVYYETYLTSFVSMEPSYDDRQDMPTFSFKLDELNALYEFYLTKGIYYSYQYKELSYAVLEKLTKCIVTICQEQVDGKCVDMEDVLEKDEGDVTFVKLGEKLAKPVQRFDYNEKLQQSPDRKLKKTNSKEKVKGKARGKGKNTKIAQISVEVEHKGTQLPEIEETTETSEEKNILAHLPVTISKPFQTMLATFWEHIEEFVSKDVTCLFFQYRTFLDDHEKFSQNMFNMIKDYLKRPHDKQQHLERFQLDYVRLEDSYRNDEEVKAEYFCRVNELYVTLKEMTCKQNEASIVYKKQLLRNEWMPRVIWMYGSGHTSLLRIEVNQQRGLIQILNDYYVGVATQLATSKTLRPIQLEHYSMDKFDEFHAYVYRCLNHEDLVSEDNIFNQHLQYNYRLAQALVDEYETQSNNLIKEMESLYKNREKNNKFNAQNVELYPNLIEEWKELIRGLSVKCSVRLLTITRRSIEKIVNLLLSYVGTSAILNNLIKDRYDNEMRSLETLCEVLNGAVEAEIPLVQRMVLEDDQFYVDPNVLMRLESIPPLKTQYDSRVVQTSNAYLFPLESLHELIDTFKKISPRGVLPERYFTFALYDLIKKKHTYVPIKWRDLTLDKLSEIVGLLFENSAFVDWRDFISYNLEVFYPKVVDILRAKRHFRLYDENLTETVPFYHMERVKFWLDGKNESDLKKMKLLCKLYETRSEYVNYGRMLLSFCKDHDPMKGFLKTVQLCLGTLVCTDAADAARYASKTFGRCDVDCVCSDDSCGVVDAKNSNVVETENDKQVEESKEVKTFQEFEELEDVSSDDVSLVEMRVAESIRNSLVDSLFLSLTNMSDEIIINKATDVEEITEEEEIVIAEECGSYCKCENSETLEWVADLDSCECSYDSICESSPKLLLPTKDVVELCDICLDRDEKVPIVYTIPYEVLIKILGATIFPLDSGKSMQSNIHKKVKRIYDDCKNPEARNKVFTHILFNNTDFKKFIGKHYKFILKNVQRILNSVIQSKTN